MFDREISLIGIDKFNKIQEKIVCVIGIGGVGGYAVEALVRAGINNIILVDFDNIDISNLNRQIITNINNINRPKVEVAKERILSINPKCNIITINNKLTKDNLDILFDYKIDYIIDCCDCVSVKQELIIKSNLNNVKLISSMGTGNKLNPELLKITDIRKTSYDPLAKKIRKFVIDNKINKKVMVVSSSEQPKKIIGKIASISFVPATAGMLCASYVINDIIK